ARAAATARSKWWDRSLCAGPVHWLSLGPDTLGAAMVTAKPKAKTPGRIHRPPSVGDTANARLTGPSSAAPLGAFYAAGPAMSLAAPGQAKLTVGQAHDPYEREADRVAD